MKVLVVSETRVYDGIPEDEVDRLRMLALMGPVERIPTSVSRTATVHEADEEVGPL